MEKDPEVALELTKSRMDIIKLKDHISSIETKLERMDMRIQSLFSKIDATGDVFINALASTAARNKVSATLSFYPADDDEEDKS